MVKVSQPTERTVTMRKNFIFLISNLLFWYILFVFARVLFLLTYAHAGNSLTTHELFSTFFFGFRLDMGIAAYTTLFTALLLIAKSFSKSQIFKYIHLVYVFTAILVCTVIIAGDLVMYKYWGFRLDATPLLYLGNMKAATASVSVIKVILLVGLSILVALLLFFCYWKLLFPQFEKLTKTYKNLLVLLPSLALLFIGMRGGIGIASLATSSAYFSQKQFANHAAINPVWNVGFSLSESNDLNKNYEYFSKAEAEKLLQNFQNTSTPGSSLLKNTRPNIILIITESLTAKALAYGGNHPQVMPGLNKLIKEGILFDKVYAASERTDKGISAVIAGYPSLPGSSPLKYQSVTEKLAFLPKHLKEAGYKTEFYYGGTLEFANYQSFIVQAGYQKMISDKDFPSSKLESKWGAYDHTVSEKLLNNTTDADSGFFKTFLTLTSHEPFIIPIPPLLPGNDDETLFLNSLHYTDQVLYNFIAEAKKRKWWKNTIVIITADHGSTMPDNSMAWEENRFHIPVIWLGGALLKTDTTISIVSSQTDIAATLLAQLNISTNDFKFSKNILSPKYEPRAFYTFNGGFGWLRPDGLSIFNTITSTYNDDKNHKESLKEQQGKAYLQLLFEDFKEKYR